MSDSRSVPPARDLASFQDFRGAPPPAPCSSGSHTRTRASAMPPCDRGQDAPGRQWDGARARRWRWPRRWRSRPRETTGGSPMPITPRARARGPHHGTTSSRCRRCRPACRTPCWVEHAAAGRATTCSSYSAYETPMISEPYTWLSVSFRLTMSAAVLDGDDLVERTRPRLGVHRDVGHLHAAHTAVDQLAGARIAAADGEGQAAQLARGFLPGQALRGIGLHTDAAAHRLERRGLHAQARRHLRVELVEQVQRAAPCRGADAADGRAAARSARDGVTVVADLTVMASSGRPSESATTMLSAVRVPTPRSCGPSSARPSRRLQRDVARAVVAAGPQVWRERPRPRLDRCRRLVTRAGASSSPVDQPGRDLELSL